MTDPLPPGILIQDKSIENNFLDRIRQLEIQITELKQAISDLQDRVVTLENA